MEEIAYNIKWGLFLLAASAWQMFNVVRYGIGLWSLLDGAVTFFVAYKLLAYRKRNT